MSRRYGKAPIVEAVIDLKLEGSLAPREMERLRDRFQRRYPSIEEKRSFTVELGVSAAAQHEAVLVGFKMTAANGADLLLINDDSFATVRLAPYDRWQSFVGQAKENLEEFTKVVGRRMIIRVGVRFINRLDIPNRLISDQPLGKFLRVGVSLPQEITRVIGGFSFGAEGVEPETQTPYVLRAGVLAAPPLIEHASFQLDIDVYWDSGIPARIDEMWDGTERLRRAKNAIFEHSITNELRELFE